MHRAWSRVSARWAMFSLLDGSVGGGPGENEGRPCREKTASCSSSCPLAGVNTCRGSSTPSLLWGTPYSVLLIPATSSAGSSSRPTAGRSAGPSHFRLTSMVHSGRWTIFGCRSLSSTYPRRYGRLITSMGGGRGSTVGRQSWALGGTPRSETTAPPSRWRSALSCPPDWRRARRLSVRRVITTNNLVLSQFPFMSMPPWIHRCPQLSEHHDRGTGKRRTGGRSTDRPDGSSCAP